MAASDLPPVPLSPRESGAHPSLVTRARVRLRRFGLDHTLAEGADPDENQRLALRAAQLLEPAARAKPSRRAHSRRDALDLAYDALERR
jgi:hypothetical protein